MSVRASNRRTFVHAARNVSVCAVREPLEEAGFLIETIGHLLEVTGFLVEGLGGNERDRFLVLRVSQENVRRDPHLSVPHSYSHRVLYLPRSKSSVLVWTPTIVTPPSFAMQRSTLARSEMSSAIGTCPVRDDVTVLAGVVTMSLPSHVVPKKGYSSHSSACRDQHEAEGDILQVAKASTLLLWPQIGPGRNDIICRKNPVP